MKKVEFGQDIFGLENGHLFYALSKMKRLRANAGPNTIS
jgi:hypothetical protein